MKILIKIIVLAAISTSAYAQGTFAFTVVTPGTIQPDCHTWTGCGVIVVEPIPRYYKRHYCRYTVKYKRSEVLYWTPRTSCD